MKCAVYPRIMLAHSQKSFRLALYTGDNDIAYGGGRVLGTLANSCFIGPSEKAKALWCVAWDGHDPNRWGLLSAASMPSALAWEVSGRILGSVVKNETFVMI